MPVIRITKEFEFEMAHALWNYDGPCKNIHGHSYKLFVTVIGQPSEQKKDSKLGMLIDFGDLKKLINEVIINKFDHSVVVNQDAPHQFMQKVEQMFEKYEVVNYQPTCENLITDFARRIKKKLPENIKLHSLRLAETATSYAEWHQEDN
ncbi:MAG: 6-carboxytetrahydropterin synthase [Bacteroidales bacterium]|nr:6-carboxytetrahydropterin synthase [Bacteroidales bacterium]